MECVLGKDGVVGSIPIGSTTFPPFFTLKLTNIHATRRERTAMSGEKSVESRLAPVGFVRTKLDRAGTQAIRRMFWTDVRFSTRGDGFFYDLLAGCIERHLVVVSEWTYAPLIVDPHEPPRHLVPASADYARAVDLGFGWGMIPDLQARDSLKCFDDNGIDDVLLYWQQWSLSSVALQRAADAVAAGAERMLL